MYMYIDHICKRSEGHILQVNLLFYQMHFPSCFCLAVWRPEQLVTCIQDC